MAIMMININGSKLGDFDLTLSVEYWYFHTMGHKAYSLSPKRCQNL